MANTKSRRNIRSKRNLSKKNRSRKNRNSRRVKGGNWFFPTPQEKICNYRKLKSRTHVGVEIPSGIEQITINNATKPVREFAAEKQYNQNCKY